MTPVDPVETKGTQVTREMVDRYKELSTIMKEFRSTLGPRKKLLYDSVLESIDPDEVFSLIEVGGGDSVTVSGEIEGRILSIMFWSKAAK